MRADAGKAWALVNLVQFASLLRWLEFTIDGALWMTMRPPPYRLGFLRGDGVVAP